MLNYYEAVGVSGLDFSNYGAFVALEQAQEMAEGVGAPAILEVLQPEGSSLYWVLADESEIEAHGDFQEEEVEVEENPFDSLMRWRDHPKGFYKKFPSYAQGFALGERAYRDGKKRTPYHDASLMSVKKGGAVGGPNHDSDMALITGWTDGWDSLYKTDNFSKQNPFPFKKCIRKARAKGIGDPNAYCATIDRRIHGNPDTYGDLAYGNEFKREGKVWYGKFSFRHPRDSKGKWIKLSKEDVQSIERMIKSGKVVKQNPSLRERATELYKSAKHALTKSSASKAALKRLREAETKITPTQRFGLGKKRNPEGAAGALFEEFHGVPSGQTIEVHFDAHEHSTLTALGYLCSLVVKNANGKNIINVAETKSPRDIPNPLLLPLDKRVILCSNEDATSLYFVGGDQEVSLDALALDKEEYVKDLMVLGTLTQVTYMTQKAFDNMEDIAYYHALGEETGEKPVLLYDPISCLLSVAGGAYKVEGVGLTN